MKKDGVIKRKLSKAEEARIVARLRARSDEHQQLEQARIDKIKPWSAPKP